MRLTHLSRLPSLFFILTLLISCDQSEVNPKETISYVDQVYPWLDTENSRWFFFSSASRPFGMVNLSPDTEIDGAWGSGYRYKVDSVKGFSHVHAWQMSGLSVMPVVNRDSLNLFTDFYSKFSHDSEK